MKNSKSDIVEPLLVAAKEHAADVTNSLVCKTINSVITVKNGNIEVPLGKRHGIKLSALAVTKGEQTPFNLSLIHI